MFGYYCMEDITLRLYVVLTVLRTTLCVIITMIFVGSSVVYY